MSYKDLVDAGVKFLDEKSPGWMDKIDLDLLDLRDMRYCVLGQLYGLYYQGLNTLGLDDFKAERLGLYPGDEWFEYQMEVGPVTDVWKKVIRERRELA